MGAAGDRLRAAEQLRHPERQAHLCLLLNELRRGEDAEVTLGYFGAITQGRIGGHTLTLTGLKWTDNDLNGNVDFGEATMTFIDPGIGQLGTKLIYFTFFNGGYLSTDYGMGGNVNCGNPPAPCQIQAIIIEAAMSESPVLPAPATLLASGLAALAYDAGRVGFDRRSRCP